MLAFWKRRPHYTFPVESIRGTRAMIAGNGGPERIDMTLDIAGDRATIELTCDQARQLILDLTAAHEALRPPLRGGSWGGRI